VCSSSTRAHEKSIDVIDMNVEMASATAGGALKTEVGIAVTRNECDEPLMLAP
jgi:hypothetical protein